MPAAEHEEGQEGRGPAVTVGQLLQLPRRETRLLLHHVSKKEVHQQSVQKVTSLNKASPKSVELFFCGGAVRFNFEGEMSSLVMPRLSRVVVHSCAMSSLDATRDVH